MLKMLAHKSDDGSSAQEVLAASLLCSCTPRVYGCVLCLGDEPVLSVLVMEMVPYDFAEFVTQMFLWPVDENDLSALLLVIGHCLRSSLGTTELTD